MTSNAGNQQEHTQKNTSWQYGLWLCSTFLGFHTIQLLALEEASEQIQDFFSMGSDFDLNHFPHICHLNTIQFKLIYGKWGKPQIPLLPWFKFEDFKVLPTPPSLKQMFVQYHPNDFIPYSLPIEIIIAHFVCSYVKYLVLLAFRRFSATLSYPGLPLRSQRQFRIPNTVQFKNFLEDSSA